MAFDLRNGNGELLSFNTFVWTELLRTAEKNGWEPEGAVFPVCIERLPDDGELCSTWAENGERGGYCSNEGQRVTETDAHNLANCIEANLDKFDEQIRWAAIELKDYCRQGSFTIA